MRFSLRLAALAALLACIPAASQQAWPGADWPRAAPAEAGMHEEKLIAAREYALTGEGSGMIIRDGRLVLAWGGLQRKYDLKSTTKSIGATALGLALLDGKARIDQPVKECHPEFGVPPEKNAAGGWLEKITLWHLATQTAGFAKPGGFEPLLFEPGTQWAYSDGGPNWLAECLTLVYQRDIEDLMFERVFAPLGITPDDLHWRDNQYRPHEIGGIPRREFGSGVHANVDAMARIGLLYLRKGEWKGERILPAEFIERARTTPEELRDLPVLDQERYSNASGHYGLLWWNNSDQTMPNVPRDAYWSWGLYESLIVVIPSLDLVVARAGKSWEAGFGGHYSKLEPFLEPIAASIPGALTGGAPVPPSPVITGIRWAPAHTIARKADGSDNWPMTWADDDAQYTAYGDGWGFEPKVEKKLSMGLAKIVGAPHDFQGINIRSETGETIGQGAHGKKASGILFLDGALYLWARNAGNSQLAWSADYGKTWQWSPWRFTESFGHPSFLNFGKNYEHARDNYVYVYSQDHDSAYESSDRMVLVRARKDDLRERTAWEFFVRRDGEGNAVWSKDVAGRGAVFEDPSGRAYRSQMTYNAGLGRYLWCQIIKGDDTRFEGGFSVYDAPEPWGPWTAVYHTERWDAGPGENCVFPSKWMSPDGKTVHMVFSGDDAFSVRRVELAAGDW